MAEHDSTDTVGAGDGMTPRQHHQFVTAHLDAAAVHLAEAAAHHHAALAPDDDGDASDAESSPEQDDTSADNTGTRSRPVLRSVRAGYAAGSVNAATAAKMRRP